MLHSIYKIRFSILIIASILFLAFGVRLYRLTEIPTALHGDELGTGYNAYLLLNSGKDENGRFLPFSFRNDFSPFIFYATVPFVAIGGLSEITTRLPTIIPGLTTIILLAILVFQLTHRRKLALLVLLLMAFSSWHIRFSRVALEMIWALAFQLTGILFYLKAQGKPSLLLLLTFIFFGL